jgi:circadian clock protein KaiC
MGSIGLRLEPYLNKGLLRIQASRPTLYGLEMHLVQVHKMVSEFEPRAVIVDPISNFVSTGTNRDAQAMLLRLVDFLKARQITALFTHLTAGGRPIEATDVGISSIIDTWLLVREIELGGMRKRCLYVVKSRGMHHSNEIRELQITADGVGLKTVSGRRRKKGTTS